MSASSKKKLRKEQNAALLTEKQQQAQKEAKKLKVTTIVFVAVLLAIVVAFAAIMIVNGVKNSGVIEKNTIAATVDGHKVNSVEFNYYYNDMVNNTYNEWYNMYGDSMSTYLMMMGLDLTKPLSEQAYTGGEEEMTWADYFVDSALERIKSDYALYDAAIAAGHELTAEEQESIDNAVGNMSFYAQIYGFGSIDQYLKAMYGAGAKEKSYSEYSYKSALATSYYNAHSESLTYDIGQIREYEADIATDYNSYNYAYYYLNYTKFLTEGTKDENGGTTYTDEQHAAAREEAKKVADSLATAENVEALDKAIAALDINKSATNAASTKANNTLGSSVNSTLKDWVTNASRLENDITVIPYETTSTDADGKETTTISGYYVVMFQSVETNERPVGNVRHLLVKFEGGTKGEDGVTTYSDAEKAAAKTEAEGYLKTWTEGDKTEESFIELVKKNSDDSSASEGGLFENITPNSNYVENFLNWSIDEGRKEGDTAVIETEYGYHVMYYVGASTLNYRDMMISDDMRAEDLEEWYNGIVDAVSADFVDTKHVNRDLIISPEN